MCARDRAARDLAERMACAFLAASGIAVEPGEPAAEPFVRMYLPAAEAVAEVQAKADEIAAQLNSYMSVLAKLLAQEAVERGELDIWPDVVLPDEYLQSLDWDSLLSRRAGDA